MRTLPVRLMDILRRFGPLAAIVLVLGLAYALDLGEIVSLEWLAAQRETLHARVADNYLRALLIYAAIYVLAVATAFPAASVLTISGGFLFGWMVAGFTVVVSATVGATLLFLAARTSFGSGLRKLAGPRVARLAEAFERNAFSTMVILRLAPVIPYFIMNIAPALFRVRVSSYVAASLIGIAPGTFAYAYLGSGIDSVLVSAERAGRTVSVADLVTPQITFAFFALAVVAAIPLVLRWLFSRRLDRARGH